MFISLAFNQEVFPFKYSTILKYHRLKKTVDYFDCTVKLVLSVKKGKQAAKGKQRGLQLFHHQPKLKSHKTLAPGCYLF